MILKCDKCGSLDTSYKVIERPEEVVLISKARGEIDKARRRSALLIMRRYKHIIVCKDCGNKIEWIE